MTSLLDPTAHADNWLGALAVLLVAVAVGAVLPVLPTGALVSAMAALAHHRSWLSFTEVLAVGAAAAYLGDLALYALLLRGSHTRVGRMLRRRSDGHDHAHLEHLADRLARRDTVTLTTSRLLPGARVPVLVAAATTQYPVVRFAVANVVPALGWAVVYAGLGLAGRSLSDRPWVGALLAVGFGLAASGLVNLVRRRAR